MNLFYSLQRGANCLSIYLRENYTVPRFQWGSNISRGGGGGGGLQMLISIETHITRDFQGGSGPPTPPPPSGYAHWAPLWFCCVRIHVACFHMSWLEITFPRFVITIRRQTEKY